MKILLLVLIATAAVRCVDTTEKQELQAVVEPVPAAENQPRELRGVAFSAFVHRKPQYRSNQDITNPQQVPAEDPNGEPVGDEPVGDEPVGDEPVGDEPVGDEPVGDEPVGDEPIGDEPVGDEPTGDEPTGDEPTGGEPGEPVIGDEPIPEEQGIEATGDDDFEAEVDEYHYLDMDSKLRNLQGLKDAIEQFKAQGEANLIVTKDQLEDFLLALRDYHYMLSIYQQQTSGGDTGNPEAEYVPSGEEGPYADPADVDPEGGYYDPEAQGSDPEYAEEAGEPVYDPEYVEPTEEPEAIEYAEPDRRRARRNQNQFVRTRTTQRFAVRAAATRVRAVTRSGLFKRPVYRQQAVTRRWPQQSWNPRRQAVAHRPFVNNAWSNNRWLNQPYAGNAAQFKNVPDLLVLVSGAATIYNTVFSPLPQNGTNPPSGLQQAVYYLQMYATIRNFAISFNSNRAGIENNLNQVLTNATALGFSKNEMLAFYGYLDLVNSLKLSTEAFTAPFLAQDQRLNTILTNFTTTLKAIVQDINFLMEQNKAVADATNALTSNDPSVANPTMQNFQQIDAALLLIPNLLSIYANIQNSIADLKLQLNNVQGIRVEIQSVVSNMQLIVNGQASQVTNGADKLLTAAVVALIYSIMG